MPVSQPTAQGRSPSPVVPCRLRAGVPCSAGSWWTASRTARMRGGAEGPPAGVDQGRAERQGGGGGVLGPQRFRIGPASANGAPSRGLLKPVVAGAAGTTPESARPRVPMRGSPGPSLSVPRHAVLGGGPCSCAGVWGDNSVGRWSFFSFGADKFPTEFFLAQFGALPAPWPLRLVGGWWRISLSLVGGPCQADVGKTTP